MGNHYNLLIFYDPRGVILDIVNEHNAANDCVEINIFTVVSKVSSVQKPSTTRGGQVCTR